MSGKIHTVATDKSSTPIPAPMAKAAQPSAQPGQETTEPATQWDSPHLPGHSLSRIGVHYGSALPVQAKLTVGPVNDHYEQEADHVAQRVVEQINRPVAQRQEMPKEEEEKLQAKPLISSLQRQEAPKEDEERLKMKPLNASIQRQETAEEDDELQTKALADSIQRQEVPKEDEEKLQTKPLISAIQRQETPEDEDKLQSKSLADSIQRQEMPKEDEEQLQSKPLASVLQRQETPEDEDKLQSKSLTDSIQRQEMPKEDEEQLQSKPIQRRSDGSMAATPQLENAIQQSRGSGQPLSDSTRQSMEGAFGTDFSGVRVHTDAQADQLNHSIQARAFTTGQDIYFRQGEHSPGTRAGQELLAHELTHVVQQNRLTPLVQRYTAYSNPDQSSGKSLGWKHPSSTAIRVSDDGLMVVEDKGWNPGTNKKAWTTRSNIASSNAALKSAGSFAKLVEKPGTVLTGHAPSRHALTRTLVEVEPQKAVGPGTFSLISDCGSACRQVMGSGTEDVAVLNSGRTEKYTKPETYHGGTPTTPEVFFAEILRREFGTALSLSALYDKYAKLSPRRKRAFDRKYGINKFATPKVGQGQTIMTWDQPGYRAPAGSWNFHYAATVLTSGYDHVTLESAAGWGPTDWIFNMHGPATKAQTFHQEHGSIIGGFGTHHTTMVVQSEASLFGQTSVDKVHLVRDPTNPAGTIIVKLPVGTRVYTLIKARNWRKVRIVAGPLTGNIGWISNRFFKR